MMRWNSGLCIVAMLVGCSTGATLRKEADVIETQLDRSWDDGAYRCAPDDLAQAEAQLVFVRSHLDRGHPVRASYHRDQAKQAMLAVLQTLDTCPKISPDRDQDGIFDSDDACPDEVGPAELQGCPDTDGDGVIDPKDKCPTIAGPAANQGCPYGDADGDGLTDDIDECPRAKEDVDQFEDDDGCPDPDNDNDGVPDVRDVCPLRPETVNGFEDDDGCPDVKTKLIKVNRELRKIELKQRVFFATARSRIRSRSHALLNEVVAVLKANPTMTVLVEGHTDSVGSNATNLRLSQRRADAVRRYLTNKGIASERLTAIGFGEEKPIDSNRTRWGRERNRRVEFTITSE
ncbi:MAG: OmpA family protein [Myxococcota bacterium]